MTDDGVVREYLDLEKAKQKISSINNGDRLIAEVNSLGELNTDLDKIAHTLKELNIEVEEEQLYKLLNLCGEYLQRLRSRSKNKLEINHIFITLYCVCTFYLILL